MPSLNKIHSLLLIQALITRYSDLRTFVRLFVPVHEDEILTKPFSRILKKIDTPESYIVLFFSLEKLTL